jgi:AbrB family looped-hinge helix DNA binding protein
MAVARSWGMVVNEAEVSLRKKNQLTLPDRIAERLGVRPGDRLVFSLDDETGAVSVRPVLKSYAGTLNGVYGTPEEVQAYIDAERASWEQ